MILLDGKELENLREQNKEIQRVMYGTKPVWENFKAYKLGTGTSFNVASIYPNYNQLTVDNFFIKSVTRNPTFSDSIVASQYGPRLGGGAGLTKTYNASTGVLSANYHASGSGTDTSTVTIVFIPDIQKQIENGRVVYLGNGRSFDMRNISVDWANLTNDNFLISSANYTSMNQRYYEGGAYSCSGYGQLGFSYNSSTGVLQAYSNLIFTNNGGGWLSNVYSNANMYFVRKAIV